MSRVWSAIGLGRPELRAWALYDWANSVFMTSVLQIFPIYFARVAAHGLTAAQATARFGAATALAMAVIAVASPLLGVVADHAGAKRTFLGGFVLLGVAATSGMALVGPGDWRLGAALLALANIGFAGSAAFYDSLLPHVARPDEIDRVSTAGFALGYLSGGLVLAVNLAWIEWPGRFGFADSNAATRASFLAAAVWWLVFSVPLFRHVAEPPRSGVGAPPGLAQLLTLELGRVGSTLREVRRFRQAFLMLFAFLVYNDGINTVTRMGTSYGTEIGIGQGALLGAVLLIQFLAVPFSFLFGSVAARIGARPTILLGLAVYVVIAGVGYFMRNALHFFVLAALVGAVMGGTQALSRSLFATLIPKARSAEFFGFFGVFDKFAGIVGPALFAAAAGRLGTSRPAILALVVFFVAGGLVLSRVDIAAGQRAAREAELEP